MPTRIFGWGALLVFLELSGLAAAVPHRSGESTPVGDVEVRECIRRQAIVTSELSSQVYLVTAMAGVGLLPLSDHDLIATSSKGRQWTAKTDASGFVQFKLPVGDYQLHVPYGSLDMLYQDVKVTRSGKKQTIAAIANVTCGLVCTVASAGPLAEPPQCLFKR